MAVIWKFPIPINDEFTISMPAGAQLLHFASQGAQPVIWALVDPDDATETRSFRLAGTGHPINTSPERLNYVGTCFLNGGTLVFHLFEIDRIDEKEIRALVSERGAEE